MLYNNSNLNLKTIFLVLIITLYQYYITFFYFINICWIFKSFRMHSKNNLKKPNRKIIMGCILSTSYHVHWKFSKLNLIYTLHCMASIKNKIYNDYKKMITCNLKSWIYMICIKYLLTILLVKRKLCFCSLCNISKTHIKGCDWL